MNKNLLTTIFTLIFLVKSFSQCVVTPISLDDRINSSTLVIEAKVESKNSFWNEDNSLILTSNTLKISKIYKGENLISEDEISLITLGGEVGLKKLKVDPELELETGAIGIFILTKKDNQWVSESSVQGFINFDKNSFSAFDYFNTYNQNELRTEIEKICGQKAVNINEKLTQVQLSFNSKRAAPTITSFSPKTLSAGTNTEITIRGTNFNANRDTSSVQFRNADVGTNSFIKAFKTDYVSWNDTMIKLKVRNRAGTGFIKLVIKGNGIVTSTDTLKITFNHSNVESGDTIGRESQLIGQNNANGITWKFNNKFYDSTTARLAFIRALERWRCGTFINWDTLGKVNHSKIGVDGVNMCAWDTNSNMPTGVLAQCFSFYAGCFTPALKWFVSELDIRFRIKPTNTTNWNYNTSGTTSTQYHFESVAVHEIGHGHQLGHVINSAEVMHYSIANGQTKPNLSNGDLTGGAYVINKSGTGVCSKPAHSKLNSTNCNFVTPSANFNISKTNPCKDEFITFKDTSKGNIASYSWNFGSGATPATANNVGPHQVKYTTGGTKTITLNIVTSSGSNLSLNKNVTVKNDAKTKANFTSTIGGKGQVNFTASANGQTAEKWFFGTGDSSSVNNASYSYSNAGTYNVKLSVSNTCNTHDTIIPLALNIINFGTNKNTACINETITYTDSSDNSTNNWSWTFAGGTPVTATGKGPHNVKYSTSGNKNVTLTVLSSQSKSQTYTINNLVNVSNNVATVSDFEYGYVGSNIVTFLNKSTGTNNTYKWYFGDNDSSTVTSPTHQYANANNKVVVLQASGECNSDETSQTLRNFTDINNVVTNKIMVFPNPSSQSFNIQNNTNFVQSFEICNHLGQLVLKGEVKENSEFNIENFNSGIYQLKIAGEVFKILIL